MVNLISSYKPYTIIGIGFRYLERDTDSLFIPNLNKSNKVKAIWRALTRKKNKFQCDHDCSHYIEKDQHINVDPEGLINLTLYSRASLGLVETDYVAPIGLLIDLIILSNRGVSRINMHDINMGNLQEAENYLMSMFDRIVESTIATPSEILEGHVKPATLGAEKQ